MADQITPEYMKFKENLTGIQTAIRGHLTEVANKQG